MGAIRVHEFMSLDGVIDAPTWTFDYGFDPKMGEAIARDGVTRFERSVDYVCAVRAAGLACAVVSASRHCEEVLERAGLARLFRVRVDGVTAAEAGLRGKPAPDTFLYAAALLGLEPQHCAVFEDALAGVEAGRGGAFGVVVGVARRTPAADLRAHGADLVVADLGDLLRESAAKEDDDEEADDGTRTHDLLHGKQTL